MIALTDLGVLACIAVWMALEYALWNGRLKKLARLSEEIEEGYLLGELFPRPTNAVEEEYFNLMKFVSHSAIDKTEFVLRAQEEYRDYVERWIHEIKTPLTACSLILANGGDARKLKIELKRAENLTEQILYCARLRTIENDTNIARIEVRAAVDEAVKSEMELLLAAGIGVAVDGDFTTYTDRKALIFVLKQFLVNCSKYCPRGHINISLTDGVCCVRDDGPGILSHELSRVFSRGFVGEAGRKHGGGTGMGLYLAHEVCEQLGVDLTVASEVGNTRFYLTFPNGSPKARENAFSA